MGAEPASGLSSGSRRAKRSVKYLVLVLNGALHQLA